MKIRPFAWITLVLLALLAAAVVLRLREARRPPDVVVVIIDTARADRLGCYGGPRPTSPQLDRLASEGVLFEDVCCSAPQTWESFSSILTGLYPLHHGVRFFFDEPLSQDTPTLATALQQAGYATVAFDTLAHLRGITGGRVFEQYADGTLVGKPIEDATLIGYVAKFLATPSAKPRLAFVRLNGPHWPYVGDAGFLRAMGEERYQHLGHAFLESVGYGLKPREVGKGLTISDPEAYKRLLYGVDETVEQREHRLLHYDAALRAADENVGRLIEGLRSQGRLDSTLLLVSADHGEAFGEHGYLQHGPRIDRAVMSVPLIIRFPAGRRHGSAGQRVTQLVRSVDILPTLLETLGLEAPTSLDGRSLLGALDSATPLSLSCYGESGLTHPSLDPATQLPGVAGKERMLRDKRFKLVLRPRLEGPTYALFDLAADPAEARDVSATFPAEGARLRAELAALLATDTTPEAVGAPVTDEQRDQLRALGYLQ